MSYAQNVQQEIDQLRASLKSRPVFDQAHGVLMATFGLTPEEAREALISVSQKTNRRLHAVAEQITLGAYRSVADEAVRTALKASVKEIRSKRSRSGS